ncbi:MAG: single-stranded DNA-binding protein [Propionibacteriales bacterium]|nr:single-stranded DNA-binding protein [Propionibacteriales bacterium]
MSDVQVILHGWVGQQVALKKTGRGDVATFRVGTTPRRPDGRGGFKDDQTVWTSVSCWRDLAHNVSSSVRVGDPVVVIGKVRTQRWTTDGGERRERTYVHATTVSHDLARGTSVFRKTARTHAAPDESDVLVEALDQVESMPAGVDPATGEIPTSAPDPERVTAGTPESEAGPLDASVGEEGDRAA